MNNMNKNISDRLSILNFILIAGVVYLHTPTYVEIENVANTPFELFKAFIQHAVFRATVPVMACISGFLMFQSDLYQQPLKLWAKKARTILVPFLVFNFALLGAAYIAQLKFGIKLSTDLLNLDTKGWLSAAFGYSKTPINYPLHFLRDIIVLVLLSPVLGYFLRKAPWTGLATVALIFIWNFDGLVVRSGEIALLFYIGGMAAMGKWNMRLLDGVAYPCLMAFFALCVVIVAQRWDSTLQLSIVSPFLLWPVAGRLVDTKFGQWCVRMCHYSFFIYVGHAPVLFATWFVYGKMKAIVPYEVYWFAAPTLTIAFMVVAFNVLNKLVPNAFAFAVGGRTDAPRGAKLATA